jgi:hypothetical protein
MEKLKIILHAQKIMIMPLVIVFFLYLFIELVPYNGFIFDTLSLLVILLAYSWLYVVWITNRRVCYNSVWPKPFHSKIFKVWMFQLKLWIAVLLMTIVPGLIFGGLGYFISLSAMDYEMSMAFNKAVLEDWKMEGELLTYMIITGIIILLPICIFYFYAILRFGYGTYSLAMTDIRTTLKSSWKLSKGMSKQAFRYAFRLTVLTTLHIWITYPIYNSDTDLFSLIFVNLLNILFTAFFIEVTAAFYKNVGDKQNLSQNNLTNKPLAF